MEKVFCVRFQEGRVKVLGRWEGVMGAMEDLGRGGRIGMS